LKYRRRALHVFAYLGFQGFDCFEFHFGPCAKRKQRFSNFGRPLFDGVEVEHMGFSMAKDSRRRSGVFAYWSTD